MSARRRFRRLCGFAIVGAGLALSILDTAGPWLN